MMRLPRRLATATLGALLMASATGYMRRTALDAQSAENKPKTDWENYTHRTYPPTVDQHLTDPALIGAIDLHAHSDPDSYPRQWDAFEVARMAKARGLRGVVLKNHYEETAGLAYLVRKYATPGFEVFGALTLDEPTGGVNPQALRYMVDVVGHYGRIVWMPTHDSEHEITYTKQDRPFVRVAKDGRLLPQVLEILDLIAQHDLTLATGHVGADEAMLIIREAKKRGVKRIIVTHPLLAPQYTFMSMNQLKEAKSLGAFIELVGNNFSGTPADTARTLDAVRQIGPDAMFVASDAGLPGRPNYVDALAIAARTLRQAGLGEAALDKMFKQNPAHLVQLPVQ